jgi:hypothetical protein
MRQQRLRRRNENDGSGGTTRNRGELINMQARQIIPRNRSTPNRAAGYIFFVLKWPSGTLTDGYVLSIEPAIRLFKKRLSVVPAVERESATAYFDVQTRKARGGFKRVRLATWKGTQPLPEFFRVARHAWKQIPKEFDDKGRLIEKESVSIEIPGA